jgi:uncharacterized protein (TIGR02145 family)
LPSVTIGTQVWTNKNLDVARYRNGDPIPQVTDGSQWTALRTGAWCWYNNDSATYAATYGRLYNWYAVNDPRGLAPQGWHVPTESEWNKLVKYLDAGADTICENCVQSSIAGGAMKTTTGWNIPNIDATNISGFSGIPSGQREYFGDFTNIGYIGKWWVRNEYDVSQSSCRAIETFFGTLGSSINQKVYGVSVRVVRD